MFSFSKRLLPNIILLCLAGPTNAWMSEIGDFFTDEIPDQWQDLKGPRNLSVWGTTYLCSYCTNSSTMGGLEKYAVFAHNLVYGATPSKFSWYSRGFRQGGRRSVGTQSWYNLKIEGVGQLLPVRVSADLNLSQRMAIRSGEKVNITFKFQTKTGISHSINVLVDTRNDVPIETPRVDAQGLLNQKSRTSYSETEAELDNLLWAGERAHSNILFIIARDAAYRLGPFVPTPPGSCAPTSTGVVCYR